MTPSDPEQRRPLLTLRQTAERLAVSPSTAKRMIRSGRLPAVQLGPPGTAIRVDPDELDAWLRGDGDEAA